MLFIYSPRSIVPAKMHSTKEASAITHPKQEEVLFSLVPVTR